MVVQPQQPRRQDRKIAAALVLWAGAGFPLASAGDVPRAKQEIVVAAAANLTDVFQKIGAQFEAETGVHPVFSFGSTAQLTQQVEHSAPFDVFAAADVEHVDQLQREGLLKSGTEEVYAQGVLALWVPAGANSGVRTLDDLASPQVRVIAVANPKLAPYGEASVAALKKAGLWNRVEPKIVYAENINMAKQYGVSGNADAVFTALPLVFHETGRVLRVEESLHAPIRQAIAVLKSSDRAEAAARFIEYLIRGKGRAMLLQFGYLAP